VAVAHIELLLKLAAWARLPDAGDSRLVELLSKGEGDVSHYKEKAGDDE
jgi:hypothetical protein